MDDFLLQDTFKQKSHSESICPSEETNCRLIYTIFTEGRKITADE